MKSTGKMGKKVVWEGVHSRFFWNKRIEGDRGSIVGSRGENFIPKKR